jgi:tRNA A-37 threonylcarbamoyl transferase component Bud32
MADDNLQSSLSNGVLVDNRRTHTEDGCVIADETASRMTAATRLVTQAPLWLSRHLWAWPLLGAASLSLVGLWVRDRVEGTTKVALASQLQTVRDANIAALHLWFTEQEFDVKSFAADAHFQSSIAELAALAQKPGVTPALLTNSAAARTLLADLQPLLESQHYLDYVVVGMDRRILASPDSRLVNRSAPAGYSLFVNQALAGQLAMSRPFAGEASGSRGEDEPTMFVGSPVRSTKGAVIAVLGLRMNPKDEFTRVFSVAQMGATGESFAFDRQGVMLTTSRFDSKLKALGLIPDTPDATPILNLKLLDPGANLERGKRPTRPRADLPLTRMAALATKEMDGCDVQGYRNCRGVEVVGAWAWLPDCEMGVATEVAADEAFQTLYVLRRPFLALFGLLVLSGVAIFAFTVLIDRLEASARKSALAAKRLGQYVLLQEIGHGANGMVYRARHALLRRPVAIKLLSPELTNEAAAARFEHEVQITSQLTHPNTVAIYDYGRTPEGLFYYAMEYLTGIDLHHLVTHYGPQPEGRVIHILRQVCDSLAEAHRIGLIHRDVKPANIVLTRRGRICDLVKVLDFGLAKAVDPSPAKNRAANMIVGTPQYMSPEAIETPGSVDLRCDLYSVGSVGYWLLTGQQLFETEDVQEWLAKQVGEVPLPPSQRLGRAISADLESLVMQCLAKQPAQRPVNAEALEESLAGCASARTWTSLEAERWWEAHAAEFESASAGVVSERTLVIAPRT